MKTKMNLSNTAQRIANLLLTMLMVAVLIFAFSSHSKASSMQRTTLPLQETVSTPYGQKNPVRPKSVRQHQRKQKKMMKNCSLCEKRGLRKLLFWKKS